MKLCGHRLKNRLRKMPNYAHRFRTSCASWRINRPKANTSSALFCNVKRDCPEVVNTLEQSRFSMPRNLQLDAHSLGVVFIQFFIITAACQEFAMSPLLDDAALVDDEEKIGVANG